MDAGVYQRSKGGKVRRINGKSNKPQGKANCSNEIEDDGE